MSGRIIFTIWGCVTHTILLRSNSKPYPVDKWHSDGVRKILQMESLQIGG